MRFRRLRAARFGALTGRDLELPADLVLLCGHNEAGKSTLQSALETVMFGFEPARRDAHPLWTWDGAKGDDLRLEADLDLDDGTGLRVERTLQATGKSRRAEPGADFAGPQGPNGALPELYPSSRALYRRVYSLGLDDLRELGADVQDRIDHLLLPEGEVRDGVRRRFRPIFEVVKRLEGEQSALWRPDQRGKPRAGTLKRSIQDETRKVRAAREEEQALRDAYREREEVRGELGRLRAREGELDRLVRDAPLSREIADFERKKRALAAPIDLAPLQGLRLVDPTVLADDVEDLERRLDAPRARLALPPAELSPLHVLALEQRESVASFLQDARSYAMLSENRSKLRQRVEKLRRETAAALGALAGREPTDEDLERLRNVPMEALRAAHADWRALLERSAKRTGAVVGRFALGVTGLGLVAAALALLELVPRSRLVLYGALGAIALGFAGSLLARVRSREPDRPGAVDAALGGLELSPALLGSPDALLRLIESLQRLQATATSLHEDERALAEAEEQERSWQERLDALSGALSLPVEDEADVKVGRLRRVLEEATDAAGRCARDDAERREARAREGELLPALESKRTHLERVRATLARAVPGASDPARAWAAVRREEHERAQLQETERRLAAAPRAAELREAVRRAEREGGDPPWADARVAAAERELADVRARASSLERRLGELENRLAEDPGSRVARAREEQAVLEQELESVTRERDRLALLASVLRRAEDAHRREHQPDVLRRAGAYLREVTAGRYVRMEYPSADARDLHVTPRERGEPVPVGPPLSRGTRDQVYLCLRLGLLDHLDRGREALPLVLDETLVNWDRPRRAAIYPALRRVAAHRQVFLLTCHETFAEEVERALGLRRISLD